jgi:hypothetical protein
MSNPPQYFEVCACGEGRLAIPQEDGSFTYRYPLGAPSEPPEVHTVTLTRNETSRS